MYDEMENGGYDTKRGSKTRGNRPTDAKPKRIPNVPDDANMLCQLLVDDINEFLDYSGDDFKERDMALFNHLDKRVSIEDFTDPERADYIVQTLERFVKTDRDTHELKSASCTFMVWDKEGSMTAYYGKAFLNKQGIGSVTVTPFNFYGYPRNIDRANWTNRPPRTDAKPTPIEVYVDMDRPACESAMVADPE